MSVITDEQRAKNKAARLRNAADPNDGLTIRYFDSGSTVVVSKAKALAVIQKGEAELAE